jgi:hypothetical protein
MDSRGIDTGGATAAYVVVAVADDKGQDEQEGDAPSKSST